MYILVKPVKVEGKGWSVGARGKYFPRIMCETEEEAQKQALIENMKYYNQKCENIKVELVEKHGMDWREINDYLA